MDTTLVKRNTGTVIFALCLIFSTASEARGYHHRGHHGGGWGGAAAATGLILAAPLLFGGFGGYGGYGGYGGGYGGYYRDRYYAPRGYYRNAYYAPRCQTLRVCNPNRGRCWLEQNCY